MTVGIAGDADLGDAMAPQPAAVDHLERAADVAGGLVAIARDHQDADDSGLAARARQKVVERLGVGEIAHRQVRHRLEARSPQPPRGIEDVLHGPRRHRAHIDAGAGGRDLGERRDLFGRRARRLEREAAHELGDRADRIDAIGGLEPGHGESPGHRGHSRRREITYDSS